MLPDSKRPKDLDRPIEEERLSKSNKWLNRFGVAALIVTAIGLGVILKWSFQDTDVLTIKNSPFPVRTIRAHLQDNGVVIMNTDFCKNSNAAGKLRMSYVSKSREVFLPLTDERSSKGCMSTEVPVIIPKDLVPDTYHIKFHVVYDVNPLKKNVVVDFQSKDFTVYPTDVNDQ